MALARVVSFDGVDDGRMAELKSRVEDGPASEIMILHDRDGQRALAVLFFENEDDYAKGDAALNAMPADETPGSRASVAKYDIAVRMKA
jgi:hypothetical protein